MVGCGWKWALWLGLLLGLQGGLAGAVGVEEVSIREQLEILRSGEKGKRRAAVNRLVKLNTKPAWQAVIEALGNADAPAADEAQLDLAGMDNPKLLVSLFGRAGLGSKSRIVRLRVAELLGRYGAGVEAKRMKKALAARDDEVRRILLWSIERLAAAGRLHGDAKGQLGRQLIKMMRHDGDGAVRGAALFAYLAIYGEAESAGRVASVAKSKQAGARCAAALNMQLLPMEIAKALLEDLEPSVRRAAVTGALRAVRCGALGERQILGALVRRLECEPRPRIAWSVVEVLRDLSGMYYRRDMRPWRDWLAGLDEDWSPVLERAGAGSQGPGEASSVAFAGLPLLSDRLAFLIDLSGSIWTVKDGKLPKDLVGTELNLVLDRLPVEALFNVLPYTNRPHAWSENLMVAKAKNIAAAKGFYADCSARGAGNVYDAIGLALEDPRCDTFVILTDGAPSGGWHWNMNLIVPALLEANRYRSMTFDSLLIGASRSMTRHWEALSQGSGGRCVAIELK